ncbi:hypothetical protein L210DRAFT_175063 [Boletus edulis BED1]|uniref:Uncharacterized protein n=1 Tax=Boletus edulis BED1 TaxID=1328754 RepID=A0AAD4BNY6_BOLED|nr:hypothetical protein L210DRAFT_175063 [Boletus edulis BED1]
MRLWREIKHATEEKDAALYEMRALTLPTYAGRSGKPLRQGMQVGCGMGCSSSENEITYKSVAQKPDSLRLICDGIGRAVPGPECRQVTTEIVSMNVWVPGVLQGNPLCPPVDPTGFPTRSESEWSLLRKCNERRSTRRRAPTRGRTPRGLATRDGHQLGKTRDDVGAINMGGASTWTCPRGGGRFAGVKR